MSSPSDLVRLFQQLDAGSEDAARELVDKYSEPIRHVIRRHLHHVARPATDSADLTQQVWVSVLRRDLSPALLGSSEALLAFLCGLARNKALVASRHHRAQKRDRGREVSLDDPQFEQGGKLHDVPLHDIGKASVPDHILLKPGRLAVDERIIMQRHAIVGRDTLAAMTVQQGLSPAFLQMALDVVWHHHERYDGTGYPDQLAGTAIPLAARITAIADVYDALRSRRVYKPALSHAAAFEVITKGSEGQFDPALLASFARCAGEFEQIFREFPA